MAERDTPPGVIPWREGTWLDAVGALRTIWEETESVNSLVDALRAEATPDMVGQTVIRSRFNNLNRLGQMIAFYGDGPEPEQFARQADIIGVATVGVCKALYVLALALDDPVLSDRPTTRSQLATARMVLLEDIELIFDFDLMLDCAVRATLFFLDRSKRESRFDDFRIAISCSEIALTQPSSDPERFLQVSHELLDYMMTEGLVCEQERTERILAIGQIAESVCPLLEQGYASVSDPELFHAARDLDPDSLSFTTGFGPHADTVARLNAAYETSKHPTYLKYITFYCERERENESEAQLAERLSDSAVALHTRALNHGITGDIETAYQVQRSALSRLEPTDRAWPLYCLRTATCQLSVARATGVPLITILSSMHQMLEFATSDDVEDTLAAAAWLLILRLELGAAAEEPCPEARPLFLSRAIAAARSTHGRLTAAGENTRAQDMSDLADAIELLGSALTGEGVGEARDALADLLARSGTARWLSETVMTLVEVLTTEIAGHHDALIEALRRRYTMDSLGTDFEVTADAKILELLAGALLRRGDILSGDANARRKLVVVFYELLRNAARLGAEQPTREVSDAPLRRAAEIVREAAAQLAIAGDLDAAIFLAQISTAVRANTTVLGRTPQQDQSGASLTNGCSVAVIVGWRTTVVLLKEPGAGWELVAQFDSVILLDVEPPVHADPTGEPGSLIAMKRWLDRLVPALEGVLGGVIVRAQQASPDPPLLLLTGALTRYPLAAISARDARISLPIVTSPGFLDDKTVATLRRPLVAAGRCLFLSGAPAVIGSGTIDVDADLETIRSAGFDVRVHGGAEPERLAAWPPDERTQIIHYAGHLTPSTPSRADLILADSSELTLAELRGTDLYAVQVALLMCCYSSFSSSVASSEQVEHLAGTFLEAGAASVIACLWPAFDHPIQLFNGAFYGAAGMGMATPACFRAGIEAIRDHRLGDARPYAHPLFWAGFTFLAGAASWSPVPDRVSARERGLVDYPSLLATLRRLDY
jgi:hypothetical protein